MDAETMDQLDSWRRKRTFSGRRGISTIRRTETKWIAIQHKTFAKWVTENAGREVTDFRVDFIDGVILLRLVENLSGKRVKRSHMKPTSISQRCDNIQLALDICKSEDVRLINIGTQDIAHGSLKLMLGLVWCLIQRYHLISISALHDESRRSSIGKPETDSLKVRVIRGLNDILENVKLRVNNLRSDWQDAMAITALVTYLAPYFNRDFMDIEKEDYLKATQEAIVAANEYLKIPSLMTAEDFISADVDELSMITYLSYFLDPLHLRVRERYLREHPNYVPAYKVYIESETEKSPYTNQQVQPSKVETSPVKGLADLAKPTELPPILPLKESNKIELNSQSLNGDAKKSPIKKLFNSYKNQLTDIKLKSKHKKGKENNYKEPYRVSPTPYSTEETEPYSAPPTYHNNPPSSGTFSFSDTNRSAPEANTTTIPCVINRHRNSSTKQMRYQCDGSCNHVTSETAKSIEWEDNIMDIDDADVAISDVYSPEEDFEEFLSDQETEDILKKIMSANSDDDDDFDNEDDSGDNDNSGTLRRCNTAVYKQKPTMNTANNKNDIKHNELQPFFRDHELFAEYKLLCNNVPSGVYVVPSLNSLQVWHGMIFIKIGMFADGCFKFNLYIPDNFPYSRPSLRFITPVFHPQIKSTGELNLAKTFPTWTPRKDRIWHILRYTKRCFFSINTFDATNAEAAEAVHKSIETFRSKAKECVDNSIRVNTIPFDSDMSADDDGNVFNVKPLSDTELARIKDKILLGQTASFVT